MLINLDNLLLGAEEQGFIQDFFEAFYLLQFKENKDDSVWGLILFVFLTAVLQQDLLFLSITSAPLGGSYSQGSLPYFPSRRISFLLHSSHFFILTPLSLFPFFPLCASHYLSNPYSLMHFSFNLLDNLIINKKL